MNGNNEQKKQGRPRKRKRVESSSSDSDVDVMLSSICPINGTYKTEHNLKECRVSLELMTDQQVSSYIKEEQVAKPNTKVVVLNGRSVKVKAAKKVKPEKSQRSQRSNPYQDLSPYVLPPRATRAKQVKYDDEQYSDFTDEHSDDEEDSEEDDDDEDDE